MAGWQLLAASDESANSLPAGGMQYELTVTNRDGNGPAEDGTRLHIFSRLPRERGDTSARHVPCLTLEVVGSHAKLVTEPTPECPELITLSILIEYAGDPGWITATSEPPIEWRLVRDDDRRIEVLVKPIPPNVRGIYRANGAGWTAK